MGDGFSEIRHGERRAGDFARYTRSLRDFFSSGQTWEKRKELIAAAEKSEVAWEFFGGRENMGEKIGQFLTKLTAGDKQTWARLLLSLDDGRRSLFKKLSPFQGQVMVTVECSHRGIRLNGDLETFILTLIEKAGMNSRDDGKFLVIFQDSDIKAEVIQAD